ncbi:SDR family NAD(P)-dependent oxidoreductase [Pseudonocardia kunmingensis]|uniref:3-oxoacyl-[acyl-carrier protein] reductase n=1 Tax=Pseudonocardia kunmingensis TaxID=630975 RepID=A0A543DPZ9_9PSEU|nr:SDR family oxidoreductase [Pseudonocardia kunmingensis]TQM11383.1 3-oxoacyl-[acyl-carrier protein] reductase [Pseudonocardia kunmingensis]
MFDLTGRAVVVTGGGSGIGRGIARAMARAGACVVVAGRTPEPLQETVEQVRALGARAIAVPTDITRPYQVDALIDRAVAEFGGLHTFVNNAGSARPGDVGPLLDLTEAQWDAVVDLNLKWTFFAAQSAARAMPEGGSIINISSRSGSYPNPMTGQYGAAKAGLDNLTRTMAAEWGHLDIRVNGVAPGVVVTEGSEERMTPSRRARQVATVPLQRLGTPDDVGPMCVYLASDESRWVTGTVIPVNGGSPIPVGYLTYLHHKNTQD